MVRVLPEHQECPWDTPNRVQQPCEPSKIACTIISQWAGYQEENESLLIVICDSPKV
jgi:hypothetical protein